MSPTQQDVERFIEIENEFPEKKKKMMKVVVKMMKKIIILVIVKIKKII